MVLIFFILNPSRLLHDSVITNKSQLIRDFQSTTIQAFWNHQQEQIDRCHQQNVYLDYTGKIPTRVVAVILLLTSISSTQSQNSITYYSVLACFENLRRHTSTFHLNCLKRQRQMPLDRTSFLRYCFQSVSCMMSKNKVAIPSQNSITITFLVDKV